MLYLESDKSDQSVKATGPAFAKYINSKCCNSSTAYVSHICYNTRLKQFCEHHANFQYNLNPLAKIFVPKVVIQLPRDDSSFENQKKNNYCLNPESDIFIPTSPANIGEVYPRLSCMDDHDFGFHSMLNETPILHNISTPYLSELSNCVSPLALEPTTPNWTQDFSNIWPVFHININNAEICILATIATVLIIACFIVHKICLGDQICLSAGSFTLNPNIHNYSASSSTSPDIIDISTPDVSTTSDPLDEDVENSPYVLLQNLRIRNIDKIIIGHLNINSIRNKFELFADLVKDRVDLILISETKLNDSFPTPQFNIAGYSALRRDRNENGGGLLFYSRSDIPTKSLPLLFGNIECILSEITISKKSGWS